MASMLVMVSRSESEFELRVEVGSRLKLELVVEWKLTPKDDVSLSKCF